MTLNTRLTLIVAHGVAMIGVGLALLYVRATMTNIVFDVFGTIFALLLVAASLLFSAFLDWVCAVGMGVRHLKELRRYLLLSIFSAGCGLFFFLYPPASLRILCYCIAAYAIFLGIGKLRLVQHWNGGTYERFILSAFGFIAVCFSGVLASVANKEERDAVGVLGVYSFFVGLQMLLSTFYLYRQETIRVENQSRHQTQVSQTIASKL